MDDKTSVDRLTLISDLGSLRFRPSVCVRAGSAFRVFRDTLRVRRPDGVFVEIAGDRDARIPGRRTTRRVSTARTPEPPIEISATPGRSDVGPDPR